MTQGVKRKGRRGKRRPLSRFIQNALFRSYADGTGAFFALSYLKFDGLAFLEVGEPVGLNLGMMDEEVFAAIIGNNKSETFFAVKPLYFTCTHLCSFGRNRPQTYYVSHNLFVKLILLRDVGICSTKKQCIIKPV